MKLNDVKHNHSLTDLLKILIFSILMCIPFIDVGIRCAYVVCNKNAYQSYSNNGIIEQTDKIASTGNLSEGLQYDAYLDTSLGVATNMSAIYRYSEISIDWTQYGAPAPNNYTGFAFYKTDDNVNNEYYVFLYVDADDQREYTFWSGNNTFGQSLQFSFVPSETIVQNGYQILNIYTNTFGKETLDNVFDYSVNKLTTNELYTWTQQTAIYTGVQTMCTQLGINNAVIPILLVYWFILTVIYIIIDIVLKLFTILTHAIGSKTA